MPRRRMPLSMMTVSPVRVPSSSKNWKAVCSTAPSCMVTSSLATCLSTKCFAWARSLTNMSISTPWPKASWTIMPVVPGSQMHSYSPGGMGSLSSRSRAARTASPAPSPACWSTSAPPRLPKARKALFISCPRAATAETMAVI